MKEYPLMKMNELHVFQRKCKKKLERTVFLNRLNTFSETIATFLKTLNVNLRRVKHFVIDPQILLKTDYFQYSFIIYCICYCNT